MKKVIGFHRTFFQTLFPKNYEDFSESKIKNTFNYYATLIFTSFVVMLILLIPVAIQLPDKIESEFENIEELTFNIEFKTEKPIMIPDKNPILLINYANNTPSQSAKVIINNNIIYAGLLMKKFTKDLREYKDAKKNPGPVSNIVAFILILMLPTLLLIFFFYLFIKFSLVILVATLVGMILAMIMKYRVETKKIFNSAVYGSSLTVLLDLILFALGISLYYIQYLPLLIYVIVGIQKSGHKINSKMKGKYVEIR